MDVGSNVGHKRSHTVDSLYFKYKGKRRQIMEKGSDYDIDDALRFLAFQLDFSEFYCKLDP